MILVLIILAVFLSASGLVYYLAFYNRNDKDMTYEVLVGEDYDRFHDEMISIIDEAVRIPYEKVETKSYDGKTLRGRLYFQNADAPVHIQFHGYKGNGIRDFSGGMQLVLARGHNLLLIDQRSNGMSDGHTISFGIRERRDVLTWIRYVTETFGGNTPIYLEGISMGAATVLMSVELGLPENVRAIWADCPYSSPLDILKEVAAQTVKLPGLLTPFFISGAFLFGHFNILETSAAESVKQAQVPITIIHGTGDHYVPVEMSRRIHEANPEKVTIYEVEGAPHGLSYVVDYDTYERAFDAFVAGGMTGSR